MEKIHQWQCGFYDVKVHVRPSHCQIRPPALSVQRSQQRLYRCHARGVCQTIRRRSSHKQGTNSTA